MPKENHEYWNMDEQAGEVRRAIIELDQDIEEAKADIEKLKLDRIDETVNNEYAKLHGYPEVDISILDSSIVEREKAIASFEELKQTLLSQSFQLDEIKRKKMEILRKLNPPGREV